MYPDEGISTNLIEKRTKSLDFNTLADDEVSQNNLFYFLLLQHYLPMILVAELY